MKNLGWGRLALGSVREAPPPQILRGVYPEHFDFAQHRLAEGFRMTESYHY